MKKSIFKITTLLLLLCAAMCSVLGIAACSSSDEEETADEPIVGTWIGTCTNTNYLNYRVGYYYVEITAYSSTFFYVNVTSAFKQNDESTYTFRERATQGFSKVTSGSDGDYSGSLVLGGYDSHTKKTCIITMTGDDTFELIEYYTDSETYTYTFTRTTMTLNEWKASPTGSAS